MQSFLKEVPRKEAAPSIEDLQQGVKSSNPKVRLASVQLLGCYREEADAAGKLLAQVAQTDPNKQVREAAKAAIISLKALVKELGEKPSEGE